MISYDGNFSDILVDSCKEITTILYVYAFFMIYGDLQNNYYNIVIDLLYSNVLLGLSCNLHRSPSKHPNHFFMHIWIQHHIPIDIEKGLEPYIHVKRLIIIAVLESYRLHQIEADLKGNLRLIDPLLSCREELDWRLFWLKVVYICEY